jgi:hypothetical protein
LRGNVEFADATLVEVGTARGDVTLVTCDDREHPVGLQQERLGILANSPYFPPARSGG